MAQPLTPKTPSKGINIEAWNDEATSATVPLSTASVSAAVAAGPAPIAKGTPLPLDIPLDAETEKSQTQQRREARLLKARIIAKEDGHDSDDDGPAPTGYVRRKSGGEPRRRDSMKRREALLKGKEGSRRRQKWENDRLLGNPAFQPPEPSDWAPHPTHCSRDVPYVIAPLWEHHYAAASRARAEKAQQAAQANDPQRQVPRDLREKLKKARGAKYLLQDLEEQVRDFVKDWEEKDRMQKDGWDVAVEDTSDDESSEEEVVFVGRKDEPTSHREHAEQLRRDKLVFDSLADDHGASFGRWLVHSIASYYHLHTWSRTIGDPARRLAYVGIPEAKARPPTNPAADHPGTLADGLPRPLWVMV